MRASRWAFLLALVLLVPAVGAGAASKTAQSVSPIIGVWTKDGTAVLRVAWEPRGLHGPKTAEIYGDVISDFRFWSDGCLHKAGERLFEVNSTNPWPNGFTGTGVVLDGDTRTTSLCGPVGTKVTVGFHAYPGSTPPHYGFDICFFRESGGSICSSSLTREPVTGETISSGESGDYVAPGKYQAKSGLSVRFNVMAGGSLTDPVGRSIRNVVANTAKATCSTWSVARQRWLKVGKLAALTVTVNASYRISSSSSASVTQAVSQLHTHAVDRIEFNARFTDWTHLVGTVRAVHYSFSGRLPTNPEKPGHISGTRCDSGAASFSSEHIPGSWQELAGG